MRSSSSAYARRSYRGGAGGGAGGRHPPAPLLPAGAEARNRRQALFKAATSGSAKFFLGTDSAPHARHTKEAACGCAGMYTAHAALELLRRSLRLGGGAGQLEAFATSSAGLLPPAAQRRHGGAAPGSRPSSRLACGRRPAGAAARGQRWTLKLQA